MKKKKYDTYYIIKINLKMVKLHNNLMLICYN